MTLYRPGSARSLQNPMTAGLDGRRSPLLSPYLRTKVDCLRDLERAA